MKGFREREKSDEEPLRARPSRKRLKSWLKDVEERMLKRPRNEISDDEF